MTDKKTDFSKKMDELDSIVSWFETEDIDAGVAIEKFKKGTKIIAELKKQLEETENTISKITI